MLKIDAIVALGALDRPVVNREGDRVALAQWDRLQSVSVPLASPNAVA